MTKAKKTKPKNMRRITAWRLLSAQEEALPGIDVDTESLPEDQVAEIDEVGDAITKLMEALNANGVNVPEGAGSVEIIALAIDAISGGGGEEDVSDEEASDDTTNATTDQVAAAMGLKRGSSLKVICGEAKAARVKMGSGSEVESRLADVETELAGYRAREQATIGSELVAAQVENGRINPNGKAHLKQCLILATEDPERFKLMYANAPVVCPPEGQLVTSSGNVPGKTDRDRVISGAAKEYDELTPGQQAQTDKPGWINVALYEGEDKPLTDTERATHKLEA